MTVSGIVGLSPELSIDTTHSSNLIICRSSERTRFYFDVNKIAEAPQAGGFIIHRAAPIIDTVVAIYNGGANRCAEALRRARQGI